MLTVASTKGGAGKTTLVMALAGSLAAEGVRVAVVDADPNRAYASWSEEAYEGAAVMVRAEADEARLAAAIDELAPEVELVLVDTAGFGNRAALLAIAAADAVLVPCTPSRADVEQAARTLQLVEGAARAARRAIPARVVPSRLKQFTAVSRHALAELDAAGLPRTEAGLGDRVAFAEMTFSGRLPAGGEAGQELAALVKELRGLGWLPAARRSQPAGHRS
ncbi:AAA family ATPase [Roseococcus sp. DSY-14]|uniref:nucleotide-binding protein n=1 Tax=Roseococcus sp. DSY-14 TaxID=3369650 RepID=UPI00387B8840